MPWQDLLYSCLTGDSHQLAPHLVSPKSPHPSPLTGLWSCLALGDSSPAPQPREGQRGLLANSDDGGGGVRAHHTQLHTAPLYRGVAARTSPGESVGVSVPPRGLCQHAPPHRRCAHPAAEPCAAVPGARRCPHLAPAASAAGLLSTATPEGVWSQPPLPVPKSPLGSQLGRAGRTDSEQTDAPDVPLLPPCSHAQHAAPRGSGQRQWLGTVTMLAWDGSAAAAHRPSPALCPLPGHGPCAALFHPDRRATAWNPCHHPC